MPGRMDSSIRILQERNRFLEQEVEDLKNYIETVKDLDTTTSPESCEDQKVSLQDFQIIKKLGQGGFGTVVLATGSLLGGPKELYAIKDIKKRRMTPSSISFVFTEKEALMRASGHPFITTLYCCFQNKVFLNI
jgi:serine/threonine protein kinase